MLGLLHTSTEAARKNPIIAACIKSVVLAIVKIIIQYTRVRCSSAKAISTSCTISHLRATATLKAALRSFSDLALKSYFKGKILLAHDEH
jgi:hypothetical protein